MRPFNDTAALGTSQRAALPIPLGAPISAPPSAPPLVVRVARPQDTPAIDALRFASYAAAPWFPGLDMAALKRDRDHPDTRVLLIERDGTLLSTVAVTLLRSARAVGDLLENPVPDDLADELPAVVLQRAASAVGQRGLGLLPIMRHHYISAARRCGARVLLSAHAAGTPNLSCMSKLGYRLTPVGLRRPERSVLAADTDVIVSSLPRSQFANALDGLESKYPEALASSRWRGEPLRLA